MLTLRILLHSILLKFLRDIKNTIDDESKYDENQSINVSNFVLHRLQISSTELHKKFIILLKCFSAIVINIRLKCKNLILEAVAQAYFYQYSLLK